MGFDADIALTLALQVAVLLVPVALMWLATGRFQWVRGALPALSCFAIVDALSSRLFHAIPKGTILPGLTSTWGWEGKILALGAMALMLVCIPSLTARRVGLTLRQTEGSVVPGCVAAAVVCALLWGDNLWLATPRPGWPAADALLFQATMPGLQEELQYRGLLLVLLDEGLPGGRLNVLGAKIGWGAVLSTVAFGLGHGLFLDHGALVFHLRPVLLTGLVGFVLAWMRERTGSLLGPVLTHNLANLGVQFL